jgi:hypothetical protein
LFKTHAQSVAFKTLRFENTCNALKKLNFGGTEFIFAKFLEIYENEMVPKIFFASGYKLGDGV